MYIWYKPVLPNLGESTLQGEDSWLLEVLPLPTLMPLVEQLPPLRILLVSMARSALLLGRSSVCINSEATIYIYIYISDKALEMKIRCK